MIEQSYLIAVVYIIKLVTIDDRWNSLLPIIDGPGGDISSFPADNVEDIAYGTIPATRLMH